MSAAAPAPALDTRTYQDLVDEALARVQIHNPEWTNFNRSDPGVTLLELFAFLTESLLLAILGALAGLALAAGRAHAADANVLRVCADPNYLPFSNKAGQGFENKVAAIMAKALGARLDALAAGG